MISHIPVGMSVEHNVLGTDCFIRALMKQLIEKSVFTKEDAAVIAVNAMAYIVEELEHKKEVEKKKEVGPQRCDDSTCPCNEEEKDRPIHTCDCGDEHEIEEEEY